MTTAAINEDAARKAVKAFLDTNMATYVSGLSVLGNTRGSPHVARSDFAMPQGVETESPYPFFQVSCRRATLANITPGGNTFKVVGRYEMEMRVVDLAVEDRDDTTPYELADVAFRTMVDRVVNDVFNTAAFSSGSNSFKLVETNPNSFVSKENVDRWARRKGGTVAALMLGARITFTIEDC